jgi:hypothetical protein
MKQKISLSIQKPCSENFGNFQSTSTGGFCGSCQKEVIDFTKMSDGQILNYFKKNKENTCGRFEKNQLKSYYTLSSPSKKRSFNLLGASLIGASLLSALPNQQIKAQEHNPTEKVEAKGSKEENKKGNDTITITGVVKDDTGEALPGATVTIKGTTHGTVTDIDGKYRIGNLNIGDVLVYSFVGFRSKEEVISDKKTSVEIILGSEGCFLTLGKVSISEVYSSKKTFWQRIKSIFR